MVEHDTVGIIFRRCSNRMAVCWNICQSRVRSRCPRFGSAPKLRGSLEVWGKAVTIEYELLSLTGDTTLPPAPFSTPRQMETHVSHSFSKTVPRSRLPPVPFLPHNSMH